MRIERVRENEFPLKVSKFSLETVTYDFSVG